MCSFVVNMPSLVNVSVKKTTGGYYQACTSGVGIEMIAGDINI